MASAMAISESGDSSKGRERRRKKEAESRWKTEIQERLYSCKLVEAIRFAGGRRCTPPPKSSSLSPAPSRIVREAADKALAVAARGRSRWSRAILSRRRRLRVRKAAAGIGRRRSPAAGGGVDSEVGVEKRVRALGRLVPGGRKLPLSTLLEETTDYIAALEMQVRAMTALSELLSSASSGAAGATTTSTAAVANVAPCESLMVQNIAT